MFSAAIPQRNERNLSNLKKQNKKTNRLLNLHQKPKQEQVTCTKHEPKSKQK